MSLDDTYVIGVKPPGERWKKMKAIWENCFALGISPPNEVCDFFNGGVPNNVGVEVDITGSVKKYSTDRNEDIIEINLLDLHHEVEIIQVITCY